MWDHPRSRGVYAGLNVAGIWADGSSPLARGLRESAPPSLTPSGIIPARAGFTSRRWVPPTPLRDHPRSRGVYPRLTRPRRLISGSSPLARGLQVLAHLALHAAGIIPARAGFTEYSPCHYEEYRDHPRSRGVYYACEWINAKYGGSSPLARGLHPVQGGVTSTPRIIPARAGFTDRGPPRRDYQQDHPRSRGVY